MNKKKEGFQLPPGLVNLPPKILDRARAALPDGSGVEDLTALVVQALDDYLSQLEGARAMDQARRRTTEELLFSRSDSPPILRPPKARPPDHRPTTKPFPAERPQGDLEGIEEIEGPSREVFLHSFEEIDALEASLAGAERAQAARQVVDRATAWAGIEPVTDPSVPLDGEIREPEKRKPIFGFHNRDYPSLWSLDLLAAATRRGPVLWSEFALGLNLLARKFGGLLRGLDAVASGEARPVRPLRFATSFPDPRKPNEAGGGQWLLSPDGTRRERLSPFVKNNLGRIQKTGGTLQAAGPLPQWGAVAFLQEGRDYRVGVTAQGIALLEATSGSSIDLPHPPQAAKQFMSYLKENAPEDWQGFRRVVGAIAERPDRDALVLKNKEFFDSFKETAYDPEDLRFARTMTQGYVSRGREWGLIDPDLAPSEGGKRVLYQLTWLGEELATSSDWS